jgi:uncharacterized protein YjiS (DUF1127 family)
MRQIARHVQPLRVPSPAIAAPRPTTHRPLPGWGRRSRLIAALLWLYRLLLVRPVGRRARAEHLSALPERTLRDIGLKRADVRAAACDLVRLDDVMWGYPSAGPLYICGRPDFRPTLVRLSEAA